MGRIPVLTTFRTGDEVQDRNFDHIKQTLNPVLRNPLFSSQDFRWMEIAPSTASGLPTFALQYRTPATANAVATWTTILTATSAGQIVQPAWTSVTYANSWVDFGAPWATVAYFKDSLGIVHLRGTMRSGTIAATAFTLPIGYRPSAQIQFPAVSNGAFAYFRVDSAGVCTPIIGNNAAFDLSGINFDTR